MLPLAQMCCVQIKRGHLDKSLSSLNDELGTAKSAMLDGYCDSSGVLYSLTVQYDSASACIADISPSLNSL
jgi:hypothetical protein